MTNDANSVHRGINDPHTKAMGDDSDTSIIMMVVQEEEGESGSDKEKNKIIFSHDYRTFIINF